MSPPGDDPALHLDASRVNAPFRLILCGVDASRPSREAVQQALFLGRGGEVDFVSVTEVVGVGPTRRSQLEPARAETALGDARDAAREAGVVAHCELVEAGDPARALVERGAQYDLLVLGSHGHSRAEAMLVGTTAGIVLHRAAVPVWVARPLLADPFPGPVVVGTRGRPEDGIVVELGARVASAFGTPLTLLHVGETHSAGQRHELAVQTTRAQDFTGTEPVVVHEDGRPADRIVAFAESIGAGLVAVGGSRRRGVRALRSVSESVGAHARSSVLVVRRLQPGRSGAPSASPESPFTSR